MLLYLLLLLSFLFSASLAHSIVFDNEDIERVLQRQSDVERNETLLRLGGKYYFMYVPAEEVEQLVREQKERWNYTQAFRANHAAALACRWPQPCGFRTEPNKKFPLIEMREAWWMAELHNTMQSLSLDTQKFLHEARRRFPSNDDPKDWVNNLKRIDEYYAWINKNYDVRVYTDIAYKYCSIFFDLLEARKAIYKIARRKVFEDAAEYIPKQH